MIARATKRLGYAIVRGSGVARLAERRFGACGAILRFVHVAPARGDAFQPWRELSVTPAYLERVVHALRRWRYDIVPIGAIPARLADADPAQRIPALTFAGGTSDRHTHA